MSCKEEDLYIQQAWKLRDDGEYMKSLSICNQIIQSNPRNYQAFHLRGTILIENTIDLENGSNDYKKALNFYQSTNLIINRDELAKYQFYFVRSLYFVSKYEESWEEVRKIRKIRQDCSTPYEFAFELLAIIISFLYSPKDTKDLLRGPYLDADKWLTQTRELLGSNEEAYASVIERIYPSLSEDFLQSINLKTISKEKIIFLVGESHILPLSWRNIQKNGEEYLLVPKLVMGLKAWYFSPNFKSRESAILKKHLENLPVSSYSLIVAGEIDCRPFTGLLMAIEKGKYSTLDEAILETAKNFVHGLEIWTQNYKNTFFIHPIRPPSFRSSEEERDRILKLNQAIKAQTQKSKASSSIIYLDILAELSDPNNFLLEKYNSGDEVHLNSSYLPILQVSLQ